MCPLKAKEGEILGRVVIAYYNTTSKTVTSFSFKHRLSRKSPWVDVVPPSDTTCDVAPLTPATTAHQKVLRDKWPDSQESLDQLLPELEKTLSTAMSKPVKQVAAVAQPAISQYSSDSDPPPPSSRRGTKQQHTAQQDTASIRKKQRTTDPDSTHRTQPAFTTPASHSNRPNPVNLGQKPGSDGVKGSTQRLLATQQQPIATNKQLAPAGSWAAAGYDCVARTAAEFADIRRSQQDIWATVKEVKAQQVTDEGLKTLLQGMLTQELGEQLKQQLVKEAKTQLAGEVSQELTRIAESNKVLKEKLKDTRRRLRYLEEWQQQYFDPQHQEDNEQQQEDNEQQQPEDSEQGFE